MTSFNPEEVVRKLGSRLKMRHLMLLLQIEQHGSLTRVAEQMATSQPAVTNALSELESMFGVPLFERSARGMTPTPLGAVVLARARALVHDLGHMVQEMEALATGHAAHLNIGAIPFVSGQMLSAAIGRTLPQGRGITATIHEGQGPALLRQLRDHTLDIVVGWATPSVDLSGMRFETLYHQPPRLIASRRLAARLGRSRLEWNMLADLTGSWARPTARSASRWPTSSCGPAWPRPRRCAKRLGQADRRNDRGQRTPSLHPAGRYRRGAGAHRRRGHRALLAGLDDAAHLAVHARRRPEPQCRGVVSAVREVYTHGLR